MRPIDWKDISRLYHLALSREPGSRASFLDEACAGDPALREELDSLLAQSDVTQAFESSMRKLAGEALAGLGFDGDARNSMSASALTALDVLASKPSPLSTLGVDALKNLLAAMSPRNYGAGEYLIHEGDAGDFLLLILSGTAAARLRNAPNDRPPIGTFEPGDVVGEISLITDEPRTADVVAQTPVRSLLLSASDFHALADRHPEIRVVLTNVIADRLGQATYDGLAGKAIHGYRILGCVGRGGMGIVYEASRLGTGDRVALKMMNHGLVYRPQALHYFRREAAILRTLHHPSIARLYDFFPAYKTEFLAMEFCEGSTLHKIFSTLAPLEETIVRRIVGQVAVALGFIHSRGLVHRDLKPSNIMLTPSGLIKLLDFGLVKLVDDWGGSHSESEHVSSSGPIVGTPRYMAPEQFASAPVSRQTDFWGLACVAYEALTGSPLIEATDVYGIVGAQMHLALPPREAIGGGISIEMYELLSRGFETRPEKRTIDLDVLASWAGAVDIAPV